RHADGVEGGGAGKAKELHMGGVAGARAVIEEVGVFDDDSIEGIETRGAAVFGRLDTCPGKAADAAIAEGQLVDGGAGLHEYAPLGATGADEIDAGEADLAADASLEGHRRAAGCGDGDITGADEVQRLVDLEVLGVGASANLDGVARFGLVDGLLDGHAGADDEGRAVDGVNIVRGVRTGDNGILAPEP